ncbi:MAG: formate--tetrahydrofolate ligase [Bryobacterales bacterium]|nr:formate--tetrahydrofolate ligase [Bryobacterales bacterium]
MLLIRTIADKLGIAEEDLEYYGKYTAKLRLELLDRLEPRGKLILVTAVTPTSHGEGKTVMSIGLTQGLQRLGKQAVATLREPSLGPVFGLKGGATGGGQSQVIPSEMINLHFNGDFHAITSAHNLLAAMIDAHLHHGNTLRMDVDEIAWPRALDMNDRALRHVIVGLGGKVNGIPRETGFVITAASEMMAILALARDRANLRARLGQIVIGSNFDGKPVRAADLECTGALMVLLNEAIMPNLVQTTEGAPAFVHAGPFANIAHGTSSIISQRMALRLADFVVNETGFAADLGAEKYLNVVMPSSGMRPQLGVLIASARALCTQGSGDERGPFDVASLRKGLCNLGQHLENLRKFHLPAVVAINRFPSDTQDLLDEIAAYCRDLGVACAEADVYAQGGEGAIDLAQAVLNELERTPDANQRPLYTADLTLLTKVETVAREVYRADGVYVEREARRKLDRFERLGFGRLPVCIAKTQSSFTDNPKSFGAPRGWTLTVSDAHLAAGAGFVVVIAGSIMRMPGLGRNPQAALLDVDDYGLIQNLR